MWKAFEDLMAEERRIAEEEFGVAVDETSTAITEAIRHVPGWLRDALAAVQGRYPEDTRADLEEARVMIQDAIDAAREIERLLPAREE